MANCNYLFLYFGFSYWGSIIFWLMLAICYVIYVYWDWSILLGRAIQDFAYCRHESGILRQSLLIIRLSFLWVIVPFLCVFICANFETFRAIGFVARLCQAPFALCSALVSRTPGTSEFVQLCNCVFIYGMIHSLIIVLIWKLAPYMSQNRGLRFLLRLSPLTELREYRESNRGGKVIVVFRMMAEYVGGWIIGLFISSPLGLILPGFHDSWYAIPEMLTVLVVGLASLPILFSALAIYGLTADWLKKYSRCDIWQYAQYFYKRVFAPIVCVIAVVILWASRVDNSAVEVSVIGQCNHLHWGIIPSLCNMIETVIGIICVVLSWASLACCVGGRRGYVLAFTVWLIIAGLINLKDDISRYGLGVKFCPRRCVERFYDNLD